MKKEIIIDIPKIVVCLPEVPKRVEKTLAVCLLLFTPFAFMDTEEVKLTTYYPSPLGLYTKMWVTQDAYLATSSGNVGIGTTSPTQKLDVEGQIRVRGGNPAAGKVLTALNANGDSDWQAAASVPSNAVMFFNATSCPSGWNALTSAEGRYIVGLPSGGTLASTQGSALSNLENRPVGQHSHSISDSGHLHAIYDNQTGNCNAVQSMNLRGCGNSTSNSFPKTTGISINNTGNVVGTNAPYIQLLVCQKQ